MPARCFRGRLSGDGINMDSVLGFVILGISYVWKVGALFPAVSLRYNRWYRQPQQTLAIKVLLWAARCNDECPSWYWLWLFPITLTATLPVFATLAMLASFAPSLWLSGLGLVFGTMQLVIPRNQNLWYSASQERQWSFGQLLPLILLVQPLDAVLELIWPGKAMRDECDGVHASGHKASAHNIRIERSAYQNLEIGTFVQWLAGQPDGSSAADLRQNLTVLLYESRLFAFLVALINCAIAATAIIVYIVVADSIGNAKAPKWETVVESICCCALGILLIEMVLLPFSRLGQASLGSKGWMRGKLVCMGSRLFGRKNSFRSGSFSSVDMAQI